MEAFDRLAVAAWAGLAAGLWRWKLGWVAWATTQRRACACLQVLVGVPCPGCGMGHVPLGAFLGQWGGIGPGSIPLGLCCPVFVFLTAWGGFRAANLRREKSSPFSGRISRWILCRALFLDGGVARRRCLDLLPKTCRNVLK